MFPLLFLRSSGASFLWGHELTWILCAWIAPTLLFVFWFSVVPRVRIDSVQQVIDAAAGQGVEIVDGLARVPHLLTAKSVGASANVLFSYDGIEADAQLRKAVNRAILWKLASTSSLALAVGIQIAKFENREWILFSPLAVLRHGIGIGLHAPSRGCSMSAEVIAAARRCEIARCGSSSFLTVAKQFEDIEVVDAPKSKSCALYFGAVRIVPLGIATGNGYWARDPEMVEQVEKFTCALAAAIDTAEDSAFEAVLCDDDEDSSAPFVFIGPFVGTASTKSEEAGLSLGTESDFRGVDPSAAHFSIELARDLARRAGEYVGQTASDVIVAITATPADDDDSSQRATDGVLTSSLRDLHVESAEATFDSENGTGRSTDDVYAQNGLNVVGSASEPVMKAGQRGQDDSHGEFTLAPAKSSSVWERSWERIFGADEGDEIPVVGAQDVVGEVEVNYFRP